MEKIRTEIRYRRPKNYELFKSDEEFLPLNNKPKKSNALSVAGYLVILTFLLSMKLMYVLENILPEQITIKNSNLYPGRFIGERAELTLKRLVDLGPRVTGSYENEVLAVDFLKREISFITQNAARSKKIELDIQRPTGYYFLSWHKFGFINYYTNIQNVVVKLSSGNTTASSILFNCHFDTVPESPGASDNGFNCAVMLEILRVLSASEKPLLHNIIFLFNGAEENPLQASHGFATQHKWRKEVKVVINTDAAGAGGPETLFQTSGDSFLIDAYARSVPFPNGGVHEEELFVFGIVPSDTDFRIFHTYGNYPGLDFAKYSNGYVYHTRYDQTRFIPHGSFQHTGDNLLALISDLANTPQLVASEKSNNIVYSGVFGIYFFHYSAFSGNVLNMATVMLTLLVVYKIQKKFPGITKNLAFAVGGQSLALVLSAVSVIIIAKTIDHFNSTMSWYTRLWLLVPIYVFPMLLTTLGTLHVTQIWMKKDLIENRIILFMNGAQIILSIIILIGTIMGVRSSFLIMLVTLCPTLGSLFVISFKNIYSEKAYVLVYTGCLAIPALFLFQEIIKLFVTLIPMTARMGPHINSEIIMGVLCFISYVMIIFQIVPLFFRLNKYKSFVIILCVIHVITMVGVMFTKYGFPYDGNPLKPRLQRVYILHSERTFYDDNGEVNKTDSGFLIQVTDRNNIIHLSQVVPEFSPSQIQSLDCKSHIYCGFPVFTSRFILPTPYCYMIPAKPPQIRQPATVEVISQTEEKPNIRKYRLSVSGPDHIVLFLSPRENVKLLSWTFEKTPTECFPWNNRKVYMLYYTNAIMTGNLEFDVEVEVNCGGKKVFDLLSVAHFMHDKKFRTKEFEKFIEKMPDWVQEMPWTTTIKGWSI